MVDKIKEMEEKGYFTKDEARAPRAKTVSEPRDDEAVVYEDFFVTGLCIPPHLALAYILLHFQVRLHQLTPNAIAQLLKFFWVIGSFGGVPSESVFAKCYEGERIAQHGCLNFQAKRDGSLMLSLAIKNKWAVGWTKSWFYYRVPCQRSSEGGKGVLVR
jgi:hypothetical protein